MKKILLTAFMIATLVACNKKADANATNENDTTTNGNVEIETPATPNEVPSNSAIPKFSTPELQKLADEYAKFANEYVAAYKSGDMTKVQDLATKQQEWGTKLQSAMTSMTPEDVKAWTDFMQKLSDEMVQAAMPQK